MTCECCGEGRDEMAQTHTQWQCRDCEQWNDKDPDEATIALLRHVDSLRAELRTLEPQLSAMVTQYGKRHGYLCGYREYHLRSSLEAMKGQAA